MTAFNPLTRLRMLRDDRALTTSQFALLAVAVLRTDNRTGRVRASQEMLATEARMSDRTVRRHLEDERVSKYFTITRSGRRVDLDWKRLPPDNPAEDTGHYQPELAPDDHQGGQREVNTRHTHRVTGPHVRPSTSSSTSASSTSPPSTSPPSSPGVKEIQRETRSEESNQQLSRDDWRRVIKLGITEGTITIEEPAEADERLYSLHGSTPLGLKDFMIYLAKTKQALYL